MRKRTEKRKRRRASPEETKRRIIDATFAIAAQKGFEQTTTAEIARRARVAEGSIYNHFHTKDDLLIHMVSEYAGSYLTQLLTQIEAEKGALRKLERLIKLHIGFFTQEGSIFEVIFGKTMGTRVQMARVIHIAVDPYVRLIESIVRDGVAEGVFRDVNPQVAAPLLLGGMQLTIMRRFFKLADYGVEEAAEEIHRVYLSGLLNQDKKA
jgi:TetR/AcrR family fatty acid metabolism transcriptional regulator